MHLQHLVLLFAIALTAAISHPHTAGSDLDPNTNPSFDSDGKLWISSQHLSLAFIPYGASLTNLLLHSPSHPTAPLDVVAGYDNATYYADDPIHPHFGGVPGRYANRIRNSSFTLAARDGIATRYHLLPNEHPTEKYSQGTNTLHGGPSGWDHREWAVVACTNSSVTFALDDYDGSQGFPGGLTAFATYAVDGWDWMFKMVAVPTVAGVMTPVMLSSHVYWNLDGFVKDEGDRTVLGHELWLPDAKRRVAVDANLIPTGEILENGHGGANDFWSAPKNIGQHIRRDELVGYDTCYILDRDDASISDWRRSPIARLSSTWSGVQLDIFSNQEGFQVYSCNEQDGTTPLKKTQDLAAGERTIPKYGCLVMEVQDWIDGLNHPEWGREGKQVFEAGGDSYVLEALYRFGVNTPRVGHKSKAN